MTLHQQQQDSVPGGVTPLRPAGLGRVCVREFTGIYNTNTNTQLRSLSGFKERDPSQPTSRILLCSRGTVVLNKKFIHQAQWPSTVLTEH